MNELSDYELKNVKGGFSLWAALGIIGLLIFGSGVIDGFTRPIKCN